MNTSRNEVGGEEAVALYRRYIAAENERNRDGMERCLGASLQVAVNGVATLADRAADAATTDRLLVRYPDYRRDIVTVGILAGEAAPSDEATVVAEWTMRGSSNGDQPELCVNGVTIARVALENGQLRIVRAGLYADGAAMDIALRN